MAQTQPPGIDPVPTPPIQRGDRATFSSRVDAFILWLVNAVAQFRAVALNVYNNAVDAFNNATAAAGSASTANTRANAADASATASSNSATASAQSASNSANSAAASANSASASAQSAANSANSASGLTATSATTNAIGTGNKSFTVQAGKQFAPNVSVQAVSAADPTLFMYGTVVSYSDTTLVINSTITGGTGNASNWNISVVGARGIQGPVGPTGSGNLAGSINYLKGSTVASAAAPDIWSAGGNYVPVSGTAAITGFPAAPQPGTWRRLLAQGAFAMTNGANLVIKGGSFTANPGDEIDVYAETTTVFRVTRIPAAGARIRTVVLTAGTSFTIPAQDFTIEAVGGGTGGNGSGAPAAGLSGRSAGYVKKAFTGATVGAVASISIGAPGAAGTAGTNGGSGGDTSFALTGFTTVVASASSTSSGGDLTVEGSVDYTSSNGGSSVLGLGGVRRYTLGDGTNIAARAATGYGAGGYAGTALAGSNGPGGAGTGGVIIITYVG